MAGLYEVRAMRNAETILAVIAERGRNGLHLERVYRLLFNQDLYLRAYGRIYRNDGAMTRGSTDETVDGMSLGKIDAIIDLIRQERYRWTPVRRVEIPKSNGKTRPLGIPTWSDKLLQEVVRSLLEAYYEPQFSPRSHGFRPGHGCHTALVEVDQLWTGTKWFIEGDIKGCFDNIDHQVLLSILREKIRDGRFLNLIEGLLKAGYLEDWRYNKTLSGTPQGGIASPLLANVYLDRLDKYVERTLVPEYTKGKNRKIPAEYSRVYRRIKTLKARGKDEEAAGLRKVLATIPTSDYYDPNYRRLRYIRYADDFLLGLAGTKEEAETIKGRIATFLREELKLEMSQEKTLIGHAVTEPARFLGYEIKTRRSNHNPTANGYISLRVPRDKLKGYCDRYRREGKPVHRVRLIDDSDFSIVDQYGSEYRGIVQYYLKADNVSWFERLYWVMRTSLLKTLARKHKSTSMKMARKYRAITVPRKCVEVLIPRDDKEPLRAIFGDPVSLRYDKQAALKDIDPATQVKNNVRTEILQRLLANTCECCGSRENIEVHHIRRLSDLKIRGRELPQWKVIMASRRRKTLVVCQECHHRIHAGLETRKPHP
jgi:group II intron reverse transcriptase/maturase